MPAVSSLSQKQGSLENQRRELEAREQIRLATLELGKEGSLPDGTAARFLLLCAYQISGGTLYKNKDLWHPKHINEEQRQALLVKTEADAPPAQATSEEGTSLLRPTVCNEPADKASSDSVSPESEQKQVSARNLPSDGALSPDEAPQEAQTVGRTPPPE